MSIRWQTHRTDQDGMDHVFSSAFQDDGQLVFELQSPQTGVHQFSGRDVVFLRDVIDQAVSALEAEIEHATYDRVADFDLDAPARARKRWSEDDHRMLVEMLWDGNPIGEICEALERTPMAVLTRVFTKGLARLEPIVEVRESGEN